MHKLRAVYDALDTGQYQQALKQCNQILKKKPDLPLVKALKALSLVRTGSPAEGVALCRSIQNASPPPSEESVLNAMLLVYKQTGNLEEMCKCYEAAWQVDPKNEELATGVFFSYVRVSNFAKQQQIALKLFKQFPSRDGYYMWAVVSTFLQGLATNTPQLLQLAEKLMERVVAENKIKTSETLLFYIFMLTHAGKSDKVIELLAGPQGTSLLNDAIPGERIHMLAKLLIKTNKPEEANKLYYERIKEDPDDWAAYSGYLGGLFETHKEAGGLKRDSPAFVEARDFIRGFQQLPKLIRGPLLAEIDLESRLLELGDQKGDVLLDLFFNYFEKFGAKPCCTYDLRPYLKHVPKESRQAFTARLRAAVPPRPHTTTFAVQQSVTVHQISRILGQHKNLTTEEKITLVGALIAEYETATTIGTPREPSERVVGDDLVLLAVHTLTDLAQKGESQRLHEAVALLEWARTISKSNFQFLLHLVDIYKKLEAFKPITAIWPLLSIRYIQLDTLLHLVFDNAIQLGYHQQLTPILELFLKFHDHSGGTPDSIIQAYSHNSYSKVKEFLDFKSRLERSHQLAIVQTEQIFISLHTGDPSLAHATAILQAAPPHVLAFDDNSLQNLSSNQDVNTLDQWDPLEEERVPFPRSEKLTELKLRRLVLAMLVAAVSDDSAKFQTAFTALTSETEKEKSDSGVANKLIWRCTSELFGAHSAFVLATNSQDVEVVKTAEQSFQDKLKTLLNSLQHTHDHIKTTLDQSPPAQRISLLYRFAVELVCWVALISQNWVELQKKKTKKGKKEWVKATLEPFFVALHNLTTALPSLSLREAQAPTNAQAFTEGTPKELKDLVDVVSREVTSSHKQSHTTISGVTASRAKVLSSVHL